MRGNTIEVQACFVRLGEREPVVGRPMDASNSAIVDLEVVLCESPLGPYTLDNEAPNAGVL